MIAPPAEFIEAAADSLAKMDALTAAAQARELGSFGDARAQAIGASGLTPDLETGYALGLAVARFVISRSAAIARAGINPDDIL